MNDDKVRCFGGDDPLHLRYHDEEWGHPLPDTPDERAMFERLCLEGFEAGLSWLTILRKREAFRDAFAGFDPAKVAAFDEEDVERLMSNPAIIRNRAKINAAIGNARALLALHDEGLRLTDLIAGYAPPARLRRPQSFDEVPSQTDGSVALSRDLKKRGFRFVGPTTLYALMQAVGMVDDHIASCWLVQERP